MLEREPSNQALAILESMKPITGKHEYVFLTAQGLRNGADIIPIGKNKNVNA